MTKDEWERSEDVAALLAHAALTVPRRHLCLVLAELAQPAVEAHAHEHPRDWSLALGLAVVRAWCFFEASDEEVRAASALLPRPRAERRSGVSIALGVWRCVELAAWPTQPPVPPRSFGLEERPQDFARAARLCARALLGFRGRGTAAKFVHEHLVFTPHAEREWLPGPGIVVAGPAVLRIDGWRLGDCVAREAFMALSAERSVAFDAAQQSAPPESEAQLAHRAFVQRCIDQREQKRAKDAVTLAGGGTIVEEVVTDGRAVRRLTCFPPSSGEGDAEVLAAAEAVVRADQRRMRARSVAFVALVALAVGGLVVSVVN